MATKSTIEELFERIRRRRSGIKLSPGESAEMIREIRQEREDHLMRIIEEKRSSSKRHDS